MNTKFEHRRAKSRRANTTPTLFQLLTPAQNRQARKIAYKAALAVIG